MASHGIILEYFVSLHKDTCLPDVMAENHVEASEEMNMIEELGKLPEDNKCLHQESSPNEHSAETSSKSAICCVKEDDKSWICAICIDEIQLQDFSQIKGCEHSYCINCILRWASYKANAWCPQCRVPFSMVFLYRTLEGSLSDYMVEESVFLLLCASWFKALPASEDIEPEDYYVGYDEDYEEEESVYSVRLGNRRWGENGFVRGGRMEARPVTCRGSSSNGSSSGSSSRAKTVDGALAGNDMVNKQLGRRAKRAQQRQNFDTSTAVKGPAGHARNTKR